MKLNTLQAKLILGKETGLLYSEDYEATFRVDRENPQEFLQFPAHNHGEGLLDVILGYHNFLIEKSLQKKLELKRDYEEVSKLIGASPVYFSGRNDSVKEPEIFRINDDFKAKFGDFSLTLDLDIENLRDRRNSHIVRTYNAKHVTFGNIYNFKKAQYISCGLSYHLF